MNTPVNFELAKLLKEKEFDTTNECALYKDGELIVLSKTYHLQNYTDCIKAPTIADVVMWLYDKHDIWIDVVLSRNEKRFTFMIQSLSFDANKFLNEYFNSPIEAYKAAFDYILNNNLI